MYENAIVLLNPTSVEEVMSRIRMSFEQFVEGTKNRVIVAFTGQLLSTEYSELLNELVVKFNFSITASTTCYTSIEMTLAVPLMITT
jgi:hypothetical protein